MENLDVSDINNVLKAYATSRLQFVESDLFAQRDQQSVRASEREQLNLVMVEIIPASRSRVGQIQLISAATRILDAGTRLEQAMMAYVPYRVILVLCLLSAAIFTVVDLDASQWGTIRLDSTPLQISIKPAST